MRAYPKCGRQSAVAWAALVAMLAPAAPASAQEVTREEIESLRDEVETLRRRVQELESQLQDTRRTIIEDVEEREVAPPPPMRPVAPPVVPGREIVTVEISGQVSTGVLFADNGEDDRFFVVDNDNSGSRFGILAEAEVEPWTAGTYFEFGVELNSTNDIDFDQDNSDIDRDIDVRHAQLFFDHGLYGAISIGQGSTATDGIAEIDLTGTTVILESDVDDMAGGLDFVLGDDEELEVDDVFANLDGDREVRVAYQSPRLAGVRLEASLREDDNGLSPGAALGYEAEFVGYELEAGVGYRLDNDDDFPGDSDTFVGSASVLSPFGVGLAVAGGVQVFEAGLDGADAVENNSFFYVKAAYSRLFFFFGATRFAIDYFNADNHGGDDRFIVGDELRTVDAESVGGAIVQEVAPLSSEVFIGVRNYSIELPANSAVVLEEGADEEPDDLIAVLLGARVRF